MDAYSSGGEDVIIKARKPYTITKQRERWTEEEHNRFLEALKLYGRAWQRIEEHIGTKTAVQIRSHAQKFFSKLEKEAVAKGVPIGQTLDIDIPPPRPKRKPSNPYPRKTGVCLTISQVEVKDGKPPTSDSFLCCKHVWDLEKEPPPEKPKGDKKQANGAEIRDDNCSEVFSIAREAQCSSVTAANKKSTPTSEALNSCSFREVVPSLKEVVNQDATNDSYVTIELEGNRKFDKTDAKQENCSSKTPSLENSVPLMQQKKSDYLTGALPADDMQAMQNYPRHVPVHVVDGSLGTCMQTPTSDMSFQDSIFHPIRESHGQSNLYVHPAASVTTEQHNNAARSSTHQSFMTFPPFPPTQQNQDDYRSFLQMSSTFSSLIVSALLQNPAAHAAASFWPYINMENSADSPACSQGGFPPRQMISAPSMAAITTATVAAATAWWAAHGLLPLCAPLYAAFACPPTSALPVPSVDVGQVPAANPERKENILENPPLQDHQLDPEHFEALPVQNSASKAPTMSTSDSEESGVLKTNSEAKPKDHEMVEAAPDVNDLNKTKSRKQVDRSSCGSNTPYSSEVETDALEKHAKGKEESKEADANHHPAGDSISCRSRSSSSLSDSRKEVSEEGRLAFQALFSREVLPQSFSPPHDLNSKKHHNSKMEEQRENTGEKGGEESLLDLNNQQGAEKSASPNCENNRYDGLLTIGLGHGKLKARRTGFIPYKRCSVEAKESRGMTTGSQGEEQCPKRIRLEGEAST